MKDSGYALAPPRQQGALINPESSLKDPLKWTNLLPILGTPALTQERYTPVVCHGLRLLLGAQLLTSEVWQDSSGLH